MLDRKVPIKRVNTFFNAETGEVTAIEKDYYLKVPGEPNYVKFYLMDIARFKKLSTRPILVMHQLLTLMDYKNEISLSHGIKLEMCKTLDYTKKNEKGEDVLSLNALDQQLVKLVKAGFIMRKGTARGLYVANPKIFGKGIWKDISNIILQIRYDKNGREFLSHIEPDTKPVKEE